MIFDARSPRLLAVLDWELSTLGHPFADLAYQCMYWRMPNASNGLGGIDRAAEGIPTEAEYVAAYCRRAGLDGIPDWTFLIAFSFFRIVAIAQGVYKRALDGNASNPERARQYGARRADDGAAGDGGDRGGVTAPPPSPAKRAGGIGIPCEAPGAHGNRRPGEVAEWSIAPHSKCGVRASVPGVRNPSLSARTP